MSGDKFYSLKQEEVFEKLGSSEKGLSHLEAKERLEKYGLNEIPEKYRRSIFSIFLSQFKSPLILILLGASIISFFLKQLTESIIILFIIFINSLLGFYQEYKSERALKSLKKYISFKTKVLRDGEKTEIDVKELVPGDIIFLDIGDIVPADIKLIEANELHANESAITGESVPARKITGILNKKELAVSEQTNMLFMGSVVSSGLGKGIVVLTAKNTEFGKTAVILSSKIPPSDFEKGIKKFGLNKLRVILKTNLTYQKHGKNRLSRPNFE